MANKTKSDKLVKPNDPILIKIAEAILKDKINSSETKINALLDIAYGEQKDRKRPVLVGLAAPQASISKRIILVDVKADGRGNVGDLRVYINPEITWSSQEENEWYEGCFSTDRVCGIVSRPTKVKIKAFSQDGKQVEEEYEGYTARYFSMKLTI